MSEQPYPAGTRVVLTWARDASYVGITGTCTGATNPPGSRLRDGRKGWISTELTQDVDWDAGYMACVQPWRLRPIESPDPQTRLEALEGAA